MVLLFFDLGSGEIFLIVLAIFLVFGPGKIPELARGLGKFINEIKRASEDVKTEINREADRIERNKKRDDYLKQKETEEKQTTAKEVKEEVKAKKVQSKPKARTKPKTTASSKKTGIKRTDKAKTASGTKKKIKKNEPKPENETANHQVKIKPAEKSVSTKR